MSNDHLTFKDVMDLKYARLALFLTVVLIASVCVSFLFFTNTAHRAYQYGHFGIF
jgi:hypothetical protein